MQSHQELTYKRECKHRIQSWSNFIYNSYRKSKVDRKFAERVIQSAKSRLKRLWWAFAKDERQNDSQDAKNHEFRSKSYLFDWMHQEYSEIICI